MCPGLFFVRRARKECGNKVVSSRVVTEAAQKQRRAERRRFRRVRLPSSRRSRKKTRCSPRLRSGRDGRSGRAVRGDGTGRTRLRGSCRAATHERRGSARAEGFRRCRTSRSDDGCAALTGGTAASSKLNSRSPADAVLEGTKRSEYKVSFFPFDPEGFASVGSIVFDENAQTEARSRHAGHVRTPRHLAVANYEEVPYAFRRFPCVSAPSAPPGRSHAGWYRVPFASRCPIRVDVPTTSRASRCGLSPRVLPVGTVARIPRSSRSSRSFPEFHSVIQSEKIGQEYESHMQLQSCKSEISHEFPKTNERQATKGVLMMRCARWRSISQHFKTCALDAAATRASRAYTYNNLDTTQPTR